MFPSMKLSSYTLTVVDHFLSLLFFSLLVSSISCSEDEVRSLLEFKKGIHTDPLGRVHDSWNLNSLDPSRCPKSFYGVSCDESGKVASIALNQLDLEGDIKFSTLIGLKMLRNLSLSGNSLTGRFVPALGLMTSLQHLDLSDNQFIGPIPGRMSELWGLNYLNLSRNNFTSGFPSGLSNLQQLRILDLHSNFFSGDVHDLLWELRNVEYVDLSNNMFYGSVSMDALNISSMVNTVKFLNLSYNKLNGEFFGADSILLFKNLKVLDLGNNQLTGKLPSFGSLPDLNVLLLGNNQLFGSIPEELLQSSIPLIELDLSGNGFSDCLREINSTTLRTLNLSSNSLSGKLPSSLGSCVIVDLSKNMLEDISVIQNWEPTLKVLDLSSNQLRGVVPNLSSGFTELTSLNIRNNSIRGNLPSVLGTYPKLSSIDFSANKFDGLIPIGFFNSMTLTTLNLSKNHFTGPIPLQGSHSSELLYLSSYPPLESIDLSDNSLTGNLPSEIGSLGRLKMINLSKNQLSGVLPDELDKLSTLESLDLSTNDFTGKIPEKLSSSLMLLNVSQNNLSGKVPENLKSFPENSFFPGNALLIIPDSGQSPAAGVPSPVLGRKAHKSKLSMKVISVIVASVAAAVMIAFVLTIYSRGKIKKFQGRTGFISETTTREIKIKPPTSLSFSNDHLLTSSNQADVNVNTEIIEHAAAPMSATSANPNLIDIDPLPTSPVTSSPVILDVYSPDRLAGELFLLDNSIHFTAAELSRAPAEVLGRSSHGTLYKATLDSGHMLTVKWLRVGLVKNRKDFAKEVKKIGAVRHHNIVPLRAYYWGPREQERLVLTDYIQGDSLALHLYESTPRRYSLLSLTQRVKVAVDVARCLLYLHNQNLPHGNLKPTNIILVGTTYDARLTDFGLHKLMTPTGIAEQILNLGALGYRAPELSSTNKPVISFKADVYAFGVILMELLTRRSAGDIISGQSGAVDLTDWVKLCDHEGRGLDCIDRDIGGENLNSDAMNDLLRISIRCVLPLNERPNIRQVFEDICSISV